MNQPINRPALRKAGGPAKNPPVKTVGAPAAGTKAPRRASAIVGYPKDDMRKYEIESAANTLLRAEEIKKDKRLMAEVKKCADDRAKMLAKV